MIVASRSPFEQSELEPEPDDFPPGVESDSPPDVESDLPPGAGPDAKKQN